MTNYKKFLSMPVTSPNLNIRTHLKLALRNGVAQSGLSVDDIAINMNKLIGTTYNGATIYNWTSPAHINHLPNPEALVAFCHVTSNYEPLQVMISPLDDIQVIDKESAILLEIVTSKKAELGEIKKQEQYWQEIHRIRKRFLDLSGESTKNEVEQ